MYTYIHTYIFVAHTHTQDTKSIILPVAGNIACSYNFCNIGYAVQLMRLEHPVPRWAAPAFASSCLCGAVVGQLLLGWFGDRFGRRPSMAIAMSLVVIGALGSAVMTTGYGNWIWQSLVAWRFILGIGVGRRSMCNEHAYVCIYVYMCTCMYICVRVCV